MGRQNSNGGEAGCVLLVIAALVISESTGLCAWERSLRNFEQLRIMSFDVA